MTLCILLSNDKCQTTLIRKIQETMTISPTQLTKEAKIPTFGAHLSKFEVSWIKSTPPNLIEENERCNSQC